MPEKEITISLPSPAKRFYRHGWQSWSLAAWQDIGEKIAIPNPTLLHPMQYDPAYIYEQRPHGSSLGAVEMENGKIILLGALGLDAHVFLDSDQLIGQYESGTGKWFTAEGSEEKVFEQYAAALKETEFFEKTRFLHATPPTIWCSWYSFYTHISEQNLNQALDDLGDLPFDVFQVDDGWQRAIGDWVPNEKFPGGLDSLSTQIRRTGRTPGIWLAPLIVVPDSDIYRQHPEWLLRDEKGNLVSAGFNWNEPLYTLDTTIPAVFEWLSALMRQVRAWGFDYVKLDFLYAGALPGVRKMPMKREQAYRLALETMRESLGDAYLLTCGAPVIPSLGLCDGIRIGPDVASHWDSPRDDLYLNNFAIPGTRNAIRTTVNRLWLKPLVHTDPDVAYFASERNSMTTEQEKMLQDLALVCNYKATSDIPAWLSELERKKLGDFLRTGEKSIEDIDFSVAMPIPEENLIQKILGAALGWAGSFPFVLRFFNWLGDKELKKKID